MPNILAKIKEAIKKAHLSSKVEFIILYGSVSKNKATPLSDIDIAISLKLNPKERLQARIKLLSFLPEKYDLQIFEDLPLYVQKEVLQGKLLYCNNKKRLIERALALIQEYEDFEPFYLYYISKDKSKVAI